LASLASFVHKTCHHSVVRRREKPVLQPLCPVVLPRDEARQRVCLDIVHKVLALLTPPQLQELLGAVTAFVSHPSPVCRERMYDILMWIQDNYRQVTGYLFTFYLYIFKNCVCNDFTVFAGTQSLLLSLVPDWLKLSPRGCHSFAPIRKGHLVKRC